MQLICFNNTFIQADEISFYDVERFRVGDACFESMLFINGQIPLLNFHQIRLDEACRQLGFDSYTIDESQIIELLNSNELSKGMARVRLSLIRKSGKNYTPYGTAINSLLETESVDQVFTSIKNLGNYPTFTKPTNDLGGIKHSSALLYVLAKQYAEAHGWDEVLLKSDQNMFIEASSSNIFVISNGEAFTSKDNSGCVLGVVRACLLNFLPINLVEMDEELLSKADEIFLTNGIQVIQCVDNYEGRPLTKERSMEIMKQLKTKLSI
jgi:branched-subunit amino acid aminotransferase/4-amino-4-deoxychorismate lyase